ncbi:PPAPDC1B family protein [Megaselia abdita]
MSSMVSIGDGSPVTRKCTSVPSTSRKVSERVVNILSEVVLRILLFVIFIKVERTEPFVRAIQPEEWWLYKNPPTADYVPALWLLPMTFLMPFTVVLITYCVSKDRKDFSTANNVVTLAIALNGLITSLLKITVGRPRPDFYYRCYPNGTSSLDEKCYGDSYEIREGRKSFPSGHSSFAFQAFGFVFFYLSAKLHVFSEKGRGQTWRFCLALLPLFIAALIAISRTCDYHHHWQDVLVGSLIGLGITYLCYRQYYPSILSSHAHKPYSKNQTLASSPSRLRSSVGSELNPNYRQHSQVNEVEENKPLMDEEDDNDNKWI